MNQIETFFFDRQLADTFTKTFENYQWTVFHHKEEEVTEDTKNEFKVIFIKEQEQNVAQTVNLLLSINKQRTFIWILSEESVQIHLMYMKLGADGALKLVDNNLEEVALFVTNLYKKVVRTEEALEPGKENNLVSAEKNVQLKSQNLSIVFEEKEIYLTKNEYHLIDCLMVNQGETVTYKELIQHLWREKKKDEPLPNEERKYRIANIVFHIRKKINQEGIDKELIQTIRSRGYRIV